MDILRAGNIVLQLFVSMNIQTIAHQLDQLTLRIVTRVALFHHPTPAAIMPAQAVLNLVSKLKRLPPVLQIHTNVFGVDMLQ